MGGGGEGREAKRERESVEGEGRGGRDEKEGVDKEQRGRERGKGVEGRKSVCVCKW